MSIAVFLPTRKGSERVKNKNTRKFAHFEGGLLELKLRQLQGLEVDEVILSTNDEESIRIAESFKPNFKNLVIKPRPDHLAESSTKLTDLIKYVPEITNCQHILWTHVTSPMADREIYTDSILKYEKALKKGYDSLMSVIPFQNFLWSIDNNDLINREGEHRWPRTQDLKKLFEINSAIFITPKKIYENNHDRVGIKPFLYEMNKLSSLDVDWEEDFKIAEAVYERFK